MTNSEIATLISTLNPFIVLAISSILGYFAGYWIYQKNFYTAISLFITAVYIIPILILANAVVSATLPFILFAGIGYLGIEKSKYYALDILNFCKQFLKRGNNNE